MTALGEGPTTPDHTADRDLVTVASVGEVLEQLEIQYDPGTLLWFRGHARAHWTLTPSLARRGALQLEKSLRDEFVRRATHLLAKAEIRVSELSDWDWMFLMQHYHVPTRLLDWSESALIGLYFALDETGVADDPGDACLWVLQPQKLNELRGVSEDSPWALPLSGHDEETKQYELSHLHEGNNRRLTPLAVLAVHAFDRLISQQGAFTVMHRATEPIENLGDGGHVLKLIIPDAAKKRMLDELRLLGIRESSVYPDLARVGRSVAELIPR